MLFSVKTTSFNLYICRFEGVRTAIRWRTQSVTWLKERETASIAEQTIEIRRPWVMMMIKFMGRGPEGRGARDGSPCAGLANSQATHHTLKSNFEGERKPASETRRQSTSTRRTFPSGPESEVWQYLR